jgi:hypothetical protein
MFDTVTYTKGSLKFQVCNGYISIFEDGKDGSILDMSVEELQKIIDTAKLIRTSF